MKEEAWNFHTEGEVLHAENTEIIIELYAIVLRCKRKRLTSCALNTNQHPGLMMGRSSINQGFGTNSLLDIGLI